LGDYGFEARGFGAGGDSLTGLGGTVREGQGDGGGRYGNIGVRRGQTQEANGRKRKVLSLPLHFF
jgi:hypothetical protein